MAVFTKYKIGKLATTYKKDSRVSFIGGVKKGTIIPWSVAVLPFVNNKRYKFSPTNEKDRYHMYDINTNAQITGFNYPEVAIEWEDEMSEEFL